MRYFMVYMVHHSCLYDSAKTACFGKISFSSYKDALNQSDCIIFKILISQKLFEVEILLFAFNKISMEAAN